MFPLLQDSPSGLEVLEKRSLTGLQNVWPEQETGYLNERFVGTLGFLMCISKARTKLWHINAYRYG